MSDTKYAHSGKQKTGGASKSTGMPRGNQARKSNSPAPGIPVGLLESTSPIGDVSDRPVSHGIDEINAQDSQPQPADPAPNTNCGVRDSLLRTGARMINRKPVLYRRAVTVLTMPSKPFKEKLLCDGIVLNLGDACAFGCTYCYVEAVMRRVTSSVRACYNSEHGTALGFQDVVIRRKDALELLKKQLVRANGTSRYGDPADNRVVYTSTVVDPAANIELLRETADACNLILQYTHWQIRILSKSVLLRRLIEDEMIPSQYHDRLILGFSIGTLDDRVARAIEIGTSLVSGRLAALHWLQDHGIRTFGMICPSLPQEDYDTFSQEICEAIRVDRCEHVWAEVMNVRAESAQKTLAALEGDGLTAEAEHFT
jgi:DNA repair photolyase